MPAVAHLFSWPFPDMTKDIFRKRYTQHKSNAKMRGIDFLFTFEEWKYWWIATGKWEQRGKLRGQYVMRRHGDVGPYSIDNVFCGVTEENVRDGNLGKTDSIETKQKKSKSLTGLSHPWSVGDKNPMHRPEAKAKLSASISGGKHYRAKMVATPHGIWSSAVEAAKSIGIPKPTVEWRCRNNYLGFSYLATA
jgi:hypothetical protein